MKKLNKRLQKISILIYKKTGYSIIHLVTEVYRDVEMRAKYGHEVFMFSSDEWQIFLELIEEACKD